MSPRAGRRLVLALALLGPVLIVAKCFLDPDGGDYAAPDATRLAANCVLVTMDAIESRDVHLYDARAEFLPAIDALANRGILVHHAFAASDRAPAATASLLTGQLPSTHGLYSYEYRANPRLTTLGECFKARQYTTAALTNVPLLWQNGLGDGLDFSYEDPKLNAATLADNAGKWIGTLESGEFFLWVHYSPNPETEPDENTNPGRTFDRLVGGVVDGLKRARRFESTFIIACGTHTWTRASMSVPMIFQTPVGTAYGEERMGPCSTIDLVPTVLDVFMMHGFVQSPGRSLVAPPEKPLYTGFWFSGSAPIEWIEPNDPHPICRLGSAGATYVLIERGADADSGIEAFQRFKDPYAETNLIGTWRGDEAVEVLQSRIQEARERRPTPIPPWRAKLGVAELHALERMGYWPPFAPRAVEHKRRRTTDG